MSESRDAILGNIRRALQRGALDAHERGALDKRIEERRLRLQPAIEGDLHERFIARATAMAATVEEVPNLETVPETVQRYVQENSLGSHIVVAAALKSLSWPRTLISQIDAPARKEDLVSVTPCFAGVAETGSLVLLSSAKTPTTLNFVPDNHIAVLYGNRIVRHLEDAWHLLRAELDHPPRAVNLITGPSRTADVEQTLQIGVHGPRRLHILLLEPPTSAAPNRSPPAPS